MNKELIREKLDSVSNNSQYLRVSDGHPLELYLGKNDRGLPTLRFNGDFTPIKIIGSGLLEIKQVKTSTYNSILFSYNSKDNKSLFLSFCEDVITQTENYDGSDGYTEIVNRYSQWKKMFYSSSVILSETEIMGLIGELLYLKDIAFIDHGTTNGLNGWSGPEPTHKDFSFDRDWIEIKSINSFKTTVSISSIEQLDSDVDGLLYIYSFEKMSPSFDGISLNKLVKQVLDILTLESDKDLFIEKLKQVGYVYNELYDNYVYNLSSINSYIVNDEFPRIKSNMLPKSVVKTKYEIILTSIERFRRSNK